MIPKIPVTANTTVAEADTLYNEGEYSVVLQEAFLAQASQWSWPTDRPYWAYWFARHVIGDHWPPGESIIKESPSAWKEYEAIVGLYERLKIKNHTIEAETYGPLDVSPSIFSVNKEIADVSNSVATFKRQRRVELDDDDTDFLDNQ
jgi:hypothetical protein